MAEKAKKQKKIMSYQRRKSLYGYGFIGLWLMGTIMFFLIPLIKSLIYSLSDVKVSPGSIDTKFSGLKNYIYALNEDQYYTE